MCCASFMGSGISMCWSVLKACHCVFTSVKACPATLLFTVLFSLSVSWPNALTIIGRQMFSFLCFCLFLKSNHSPAPPFLLLHSPLPPPFPLLLSWLSDSDSPLAQSWPITPHPNQGAGWRRLPASEGPLMRYRFEWQTPCMVYHYGGKGTRLLPLSWILFTTAGSSKMTVFFCSGRKEQSCLGLNFVTFVTPLATRLRQPFRFEQRGPGDTGSCFHRINLCPFSHFVSHRLMLTHHQSLVQIMSIEHT